MSFQKELEQLINKHSRENESDTPDFILAEWINDSLSFFAKTIRQRDKWYGFKTMSDKSTTLEVTDDKVK